MKRCIICSKKIPQDARVHCEECLTAIEELAGLEYRDLAAEIKDLDDTELPF